MAAGLVGGKGYAVDASLIEADANKSRSVAGTEWDAKNIDPEAASRAAKEYLAMLDDAAYGAASSVTPKFISPSEPRCTMDWRDEERCVLMIPNLTSMR
jgi:hypothetical protein